MFVSTPEGPREREITIGLSNETAVEVKDGLSDGDEVVLNPKVLLGDKAKTRQPAESDQAPAGDAEGTPKDKGKTKPTSASIDVLPKGGPPASVPPAHGGLAK